MNISGIDRFNNLLTHIAWTRTSQKAEPEDKAKEILKLFNILIHENSNEKVVIKQARKLGLCDETKLTDLTTLFTEVHSSTELKDTIFSFINNPDNLLGDLYQLKKAQQPDCLVAYQKEALREAEEKVADNIVQAKRVLVEINDEASCSGIDYIFSFANGTRISIPKGFGAYRDIGWKPCEKFIQGIMEQTPLSLSSATWMGSGWFKRDLEISEEALKRILSHTSDNNFYEHGYLLNVKHPITGEPLIIDAHGDSDDIEGGHGTLALFGPIMWNGENVTEIFWKRIDEMINTHRVKQIEKNKGDITVRFEGNCNTKLIQEEKDIEGLKKLLGAVKISKQKNNKDGAFYFYLDEKWKVDKAQSIRDGHTQRYGGESPQISHGNGWYFRIFEDDRRCSSDGRKWTLSDFECLFGLEGFAYERELLHYQTIIRFDTRPALEKAIHILTTVGIVHPLQITVRDLELYIFDSIDYSKIKSPDAEKAYLQFSQLAIVAVPNESNKVHKKSPITLSEENSKDKFEHFFRLACPEALHPYLQIWEENEKICIEFFYPLHLKDRGMYENLIRKAFNLMNNIAQWEKNIKEPEINREKLFFKLRNVNEVDTFIAAIAKKEKLLSYLKARFIGAALEIEQSHSQVDVKALTTINADERGLILVEQQSCVAVASREELLRAAKKGENHRIPRLATCSEDATWVLEEILLAGSNYKEEVSLSTCCLLIKCGAKANQDMLKHAAYIGDVALVKMITEQGVTIANKLESFHLFFIPCNAINLPLIEFFYNEMQGFDPEIKQQLLNTGLTKVLWAWNRIDLVDQGARFLIKLGAQLSHDINIESPKVIYLGDLLKDNPRSDIKKLFKDIVEMRGPEQIEKDIEEFIRKETVFEKSSYLPPCWPAPTLRCNHIYHTANPLKNFISFNQKAVLALLRQGYGHVALQNIINDDTDCGDPLRQLHLIHLQTNFAYILNQLDNSTKERLIEQERKILNTCLSYIFDKRAKIESPEKGFLDKCVNRWQTLGMTEEARIELEKFGEDAQKWIKML
jgi:hypothetical protein